MNKQKSTIDSVKEFMTLFNQPVKETPSNISKDRIKLRLALIFEELGELATAADAELEFYNLCRNKLDKYENDNLLKPKDFDIVEVLDALVDLRYVTDGTTLEFGLQDKFDDAFEEVHFSNISKACNNEEEAIKTIEFYKEQNIETYYKQSKDKYLIYRTSDNKVLKSINYHKANIKSIIEGNFTKNLPS